MPRRDTTRPQYSSRSFCPREVVATRNYVKQLRFGTYYNQNFPGRPGGSAALHGDPYYMPLRQDARETFIIGGSATRPTYLFFHSANLSLYTYYPSVYGGERAMYDAINPLLARDLHASSPPPTTFSHFFPKYNNNSASG